jgi:hypothetical protein
MRAIKPSSDQGERAHFLIKETGSPLLTASASGHADQTVVVAQMRDERPTDFALRALERLAAVERAGGHFESAAVHTGTRHDAEALAARRLMVWGLATHAQVHGALNELVLEANEQTPAPARDSLLGLVDDLISAVPVRLRFVHSQPVSEPEDSGVFWQAPLPSPAENRG